MDSKSAVYQLIIGVLVLVLLIFLLIILSIININPSLDLSNVFVGAATLFLAGITAMTVRINQRYLESHEEYVQLQDLDRKKKKAQEIYNHIIEPILSTLHRARVQLSMKEYYQTTAVGSIHDFNYPVVLQMGKDLAAYSDNSLFPILLNNNSIIPKQEDYALFVQDLKEYDRIRRELEDLVNVSPSLIPADFTTTAEKIFAARTGYVKVDSFQKYKLFIRLILGKPCLEGAIHPFAQGLDTELSAFSDSKDISELLKVLEDNPDISQRIKEIELHRTEFMKEIEAFKQHLLKLVKFWNDEYNIQLIKDWSQAR